MKNKKLKDTLKLKRKDKEQIIEQQLAACVVLNNEHQTVAYLLDLQASS